MSNLCYGTIYQALESIGVTVTIEIINESKRVRIHARLHKQKEFLLAMEWSTDFTDQEILNDSNLKYELSHMYDVRPISGYCIST